VVRLEERRHEVDETLYETLRAVFHHERWLEARTGLEYREIVLLQLARKLGPMRVGEISRHMEMPLFGVTRLADRLERRNLVSRSRDETDGRGVRIAITDAGLAAVLEVEELNFRRMEERTSALTATELESLFVLARLLGRLLGEGPEAD
jgi:DNA-binding MarR family transcriptional regulator